MNADRLLEHFERISDAADAMPRLRRFVLDLATRGRLVEQDSRDEPASALASRLRAAVVQTSVTSGQPRKAHKLPSIRVEDAPFILPASWTWVAIREVTTDRGQISPSSLFTYIDVTAINKELGRVSDPRVLSANEAPSRARKRVQAGDVIYSCVRPTLLNVAVIDQESDPPAIASTAFAVINAHGGILPRYMWTVLRSPFFVECVDSKTRGQAYPAINDGDFALLPLPLPPLAEQHRIVAKVDELMALCDRLEAAQAEREARRDRLVSASLARVTEADGADATSATTSARFQLDHFSRLTTRPEHVKQLRQTILNLAVRGRLVPQDAAEGTALDLSAAARDAVAESAGARCNNSISDSVGAARFPIPESWQWVTLKSICTRVTSGATPPKDVFHETQGVPFLKVYNIRGQRVDFDYRPQFISETYHRATMRRSSLLPGDVIMNIVGPPLGKVAVIPSGYPEWNCNQAIVLFRPAIAELSPYIYTYLCENGFLRDIDLVGTAGQDNISVTKSQNILIPLPPLAEQQRIVAKVDELMALCDQLEASLASAATDRARLLEALLHEALAPAT